jgi:hypothetical protein
VGYLSGIRNLGTFSIKHCVPTFKYLFQVACFYPSSWVWIDVKFKLGKQCALGLLSISSVFNITIDRTAFPTFCVIGGNKSNITVFIGLGYMSHREIAGYLSESKILGSHSGGYKKM